VGHGKPAMATPGEPCPPHPGKVAAPVGEAPPTTGAGRPVMLLRTKGAVRFQPRTITDRQGWQPAVRAHAKGKKNGREAPPPPPPTHAWAGGGGGGSYASPAGVAAVREGRAETRLHRAMMFCLRADELPGDFRGPGVTPGRGVGAGPGKGEGKREYHPPTPTPPLFVLGGPAVIGRFGSRPPRGASLLVKIPPRTEPGRGVFLIARGNPLFFFFFCGGGRRGTVDGLSSGRARRPPPHQSRCSGRRRRAEGHVFVCFFLVGAPRFAVSPVGAPASLESRTRFTPEAAFFFFFFF